MIDPKGRLLPIVMINTFDYLLGMDIERRDGGEGWVHHNSQSSTARSKSMVATDKCGQIKLVGIYFLNIAFV